ncbi:MAG TPA: CRTAC1 family protein [Acidobacteriota bacterium]|nr:CRTAC1 family protein [Acidobacteriota bacterium]
MTGSGGRSVIGLSGVLTLLSLSLPVHQRTVTFPDPDIGEQSLQVRRAAQLAGVESLGVTHDFQFVDRLPESGITFRNRVVDDAARTYKAAHYDHGTGLAIADIDGDGLLDLYFANQIGSNELWRNLGAGRFEDITERAGVGRAEVVSVGASFGDIDNDGDPDLLVTSVRGGNALYENLGGRFLDISAAAGVDYVGHSSGAVFLDYDGDGLLDLLVTNVGTYTSDERGDGFFKALEDAFQGHLFPDRTETSILYRNLGGNAFRDVSAAAGLVDGSWSGDASIVDFDADNDPDVYILNMQGSDHYYENNAGVFVDRTAANFARTPWGAMGIKAFDHDNDGDLDLFLTDMHSDMNDEVGPEGEADKQRYRYFYQEAFAHIMGNAFYRNDGVDGFAEISDAIGLENFWPWGTSVGDVNADGWEDVFIASSMNYPFRYQINSLRLNQGGGGFAAAEFVLGIEPRRDGRIRAPWFGIDCASPDRPETELVATLCTDQDGPISVLGTLGTRTSAIVDLDNDGDLDIVTGEFNTEPQLLLSDLAERHAIHWLQVELEGTASNRDGLGAWVAVETADGSQSRYHDGKSGYLSQSSTALYFGLGEATSADRVSITWPGGATQVLDGPIAANKRLRIRQQ